MPVLLSKRQTEDNVTASVSLLLSRRMREGYNIDVCKHKICFYFFYLFDLF